MTTLDRAEREQWIKDGCRALSKLTQQAHAGGRVVDRFLLPEAWQIEPLRVYGRPVDFRGDRIGAVLTDGVRLYYTPEHEHGVECAFGSPTCPAFMETAEEPDRLTAYVDTADWWVGYYRGPNHHYVCLLPTLVIRWPRKDPA